MPKTAHFLLLVAASINLIACSSMRGNVVPQSGPTMEQLYDSMGRMPATPHPTYGSYPAVQDLLALRQEVPTTMPPQTHPAASATRVRTSASPREFHRLANPELQLYVYPHFAGHEQLPVPGYFTRFKVYAHDQYALPYEP